jgi:hypothetical protein
MKAKVIMVSAESIHAEDGEVLVKPPSDDKALLVLEMPVQDAQKLAAFLYADVNLAVTKDEG